MIKLLNSLRCLITFLHFFGSGMVAGKGWGMYLLENIFWGWQSDIVAYSLKSIWTPLTHCLCFLAKINILSSAFVLVPQHEVRSMAFVHLRTSYIRMPPELRENGKDYFTIVL